MSRYTKEISQFIARNVKGLSTLELTNLINTQFNENFEPSQIRAYKKNHKLKSEVDCRFKAGMTSHNKGRKNIYPPGSEQGWFRKGHRPINHKPIGSERINTRDGYLLVKTAEPNVWELKHKVIYEQHHGKVPNDHIVTFLDGNKSNLAIENLHSISKAESLMMTRSGLRFNDAELTKTGALIAKLKVTKYRKGVKGVENAKHRQS